MCSWVRVLSLTTLAACVHPAAEFRCASSDQCTVGGVCQPNGLCSFDDATCPEGQRYGAASGQLGGICVGAEPTGGSPGCDPTMPFGSPVLVAGLASSAEDASLRLLPDEKTAFFYSARGGTRLLYTASRPSVAAAFDNVSALANVNTDSQIDPAISADGLTLFFASLRGGGAGDNDIYQATRNAVTADFTNPRLVSNVNTSASEAQPYVTRDGTAMYFVRTMGNQNTVFRATASAQRSFTNPRAVSDIDGPTNDAAPVVSADGLTLYWASDRPGGAGDLDVWQAQRTSTSAPFGDLAPVSSVNTAGADAPSDVSDDGCRLYLTSTRAGRPGIYVATRPM